MPTGDRSPREPALDLRVKRIYDAPSADDGVRILVDRLWPRGVSKGRAALDLWLGDLGPSHQLRTWFGHDPTRWETFVERYAEELEGKPDIVAEVLDRARTGRVTLLYSARDTEHNQAVALVAFLTGRSGG